MAIIYKLLQSVVILLPQPGSEPAQGSMGPEAEFDMGPPPIHS